jgi:hypothetical protein
VRYLFVNILLCFVYSSYSQVSDTSEIQKTIEFGEHLVNTDQGAEAEYFLKKIDINKLSIQNKDQVNYLLGWNFYKRKELQESSNYLLKVSKNSNYYYKTRFFASYNNTFLLKLDTSKLILNQIKFDNTRFEELRSFELAGIALLERDFKTFENLQQNFTYSYFPLVKQEKNFVEYGINLQSYSSKSKGLAALYSAILPGSGKVYAGRLGDGISSFLLVSSLGLITAENLNKSGIKSVKTILFGSMFTVFYVGNIWGSYFSVQIQNEEFNNEMDNKILFDLHIPLRTIFN